MRAAAISALGLSRQPRSGDDEAAARRRGAVATASTLGVGRQQGPEVACATSIVHYDAGSHFARHVHGGGEEFLVLQSRFRDELGEHPAGTWLRSPR